MNVKQLRNLLLDYPDDLEILMAEDAEGNGFNRLIEFSVYYIPPNDDKHGSVAEVFDVALGVEDGYWADFEPRLVFWP